MNRIKKNKVSPLVEQLPTEGDKKLEELENEVGEEGKFDETLNTNRLFLTREIEEQKEQQEQLKESVEKEKEKVEELTSISEKMDGIIKNSLQRIKGHVKRYGIGVDEQFFSKQVRDLETKLTSLNEEIETIKEEISKKGEKIGEKNEQKDIINALINYNRFVRLNNKMKEEYDKKKYDMNEAFSMRLQPLFDKELEDIGGIEALSEETIPEDDTEKKTKYETLEKSIDEIREDITLKYNKLISLIETFSVYNENVNKLESILIEFNNVKQLAEEYRQKKNYIERALLAQTLNLDGLEGSIDVLPNVTTFMGRLTTLKEGYETEDIKIQKYTESFNEAKSKLGGLKIVEEFEKEFKDIEIQEYTVDVGNEFGTIGDLKDEINAMLNDSVKRLIFTSFINGIKNSNITDYRKEENGKDYLIAYIYTLVYELGNGTLPSGFISSDIDGITDEDKQKKNGIGALTIDGINSLKVDNLQIDILTDSVFDNFELLESKHVAFLTNYKGDVNDELLMNIFNDIVLDDDFDNLDNLDNLPNTIKPFYEEIIKTKAEREAEEAEQAKIGFTKGEFDYYLEERPYVDGDDLFRKMEEFKTNYTGNFEGAMGEELSILTKEINLQALSQFIDKYNDKKISINAPLPQKPGDANYITLEDYKAFINYLERKIPLPDPPIPTFITSLGGRAGTHAIVLNEILDKLPGILMHEDADMLNNFRSWFFQTNSVRNQNGENTFAQTTWYQNHIAILEAFLEKLISKRLEYLDILRDSQGSSQSGTNFQNRYKLPLIDPTKFQSPEIMDNCPAIIFLKKLLGNDFRKINVEGSWKDIKGNDIDAKVWEEEWKKGSNSTIINPGKIPASEITRTGGEICSTLIEYISKHSNYKGKVEKNKGFLKSAILLIFSEGYQHSNKTGQACLAVSQELYKIINDDELNKCDLLVEQARAGQATGGSQKRRKDTRRKDTRRKDTRRKRKDTRRKLRKDTRRKRKDTRRKRKDTRRKARK